VPDRLFTPAEANSALPEVRDAAERMVGLRVRMRELEQERAKLTSAIGGNGGGYVTGDLRATTGELTGLAEAVAACVERLEELGVLVKDLDSGLVDFPARRRGREVLLCWRVGEDEVAHWHDPVAGFAGRRPIDWVE
jgi:hypothetical protein